MKLQKILYIVSLVGIFFCLAWLMTGFHSGIEMMMRMLFNIGIGNGESDFVKTFLAQGMLIFLLFLPFALLIHAILWSAGKEDFLRSKLPKASFVFGVISFVVLGGAIIQLWPLPVFAVALVLPPLFLFVIPGILRKKRFKNILLLSLVVFVALISGYVFFGNTENQRRSDAFEKSLPRNPYPPGVPVPLDEIQIISIADFTKDDILLGASHNVFIARVLNQSGTKALGSSPETQFQVEVIENIKGDLKGTVTVNQFGGYQNGTLVTVEDETNGTNEPYLLEPGQTYLLATRYLESENWYTVISSSYGKKLLSKDANANITDLKTLAQNDERVKALIAAYPNEKLLDADIQHQNTRNNYKDYEAKIQAEQASVTQVNTPSETEPVATGTPPTDMTVN